MQSTIQVSASPRRRKIGRRYAYTSGHAATSKASVSQTFESGLERDFYQLLEFDPDVARYETQPVTLNWQVGSGRPSRYTPDVLVHYHPETGRRPTLFEVKPHAVLHSDWHLFRPRFKAAIKWCRSRGYDFRIVTDVDIKTPLLRNAKFLLAYTDSRLRVAGEERMSRYRDALLKGVPVGAATTPRELVESVTTSSAVRAELIPYVWNLVAHGRLVADLDQPISMTTPLRRPASA